MAALKPLLGANTVHLMIGMLQQAQQNLEGAGQSEASQRERAVYARMKQDAIRRTGRIR